MFVAFLSWAQSNCLNFDGSNDYISANNIASNDFTFEAWVKGDESVQNTHPMIFSNRSSSPWGTLFLPQSLGRFGLQNVEREFWRNQLFCVK